MQKYNITRKLHFTLVTIKDLNQKSSVQHFLKKYMTLYSTLNFKVNFFFPIQENVLVVKKKKQKQKQTRDQVRGNH